MLTIAGLGAGAREELPLGVWEALCQSRCTFLRTGQHPVVDWLCQQGISFTTFDYFYELAADFDTVYQLIAATVLQEARNRPVLYAVPGHPLVAEESVRLILRGAEQRGLKTRLLPATSFLDALFAVLKLDPSRGLHILDGLRLSEQRPVLAVGNVITQVYSRMVASEVKLTLMEYYPAEHLTAVVQAAGISGRERVEQIPLFQLDRLDWFDHLTTVYLPPVQIPGAGNLELEDTPDGLTKDTSCRFPLDPLVDLMDALRGEGGCPWDREQTHRSLTTYLLEESYEVLEAIAEEDMHKVCEELGDLLLQIVFHAHIAMENRHFDLNDVIAGIRKKMVRRHPHVFGVAIARDSKEVILNWEKIKSEEKGRTGPESLLGDVPKFLPALLRAARVQARVARIGFDWPDYNGAMEKAREEMAELEVAIAGGDRRQVEREVGDLFFSVVNVARLLGVDGETVLTVTTDRFIGRFGYIEENIRNSGKKLSQCTLAELDAWWEEAKKQENMEKIKETFS
jgi:tetrapyrrole methylase family protein/MazG family protein